MYTVGAASTPIPTTHRWSSAPRWPARRNSHGLTAEQRAWLHEVRWRKMSVSRARVAGVVAVTLLLHVLAMLGASYNMRVQPAVAHLQAQQNVIQVELIERQRAPAPSPPPPQVLPNIQVRGPQRPQPTAVRKAPAVKPPPIAEAPNPQATAAELFDDKGAVVLPAGAATTTKATPDYQAGILNSRNKPAQPQSPIKYTPTRFERDWVPEGENPLQAAVRKTTVVGTVLKLPGGYKVKCGVAILALGGGCGIASPEQLSAPLHVEFKRNNLPSATPLIKPSEAASSNTPAKAASVEPAAAGSRSKR